MPLQVTLYILSVIRIIIISKVVISKVFISIVIVSKNSQIGVEVTDNDKITIVKKHDTCPPDWLL